jgi:septum site-determining protein MinC
MPAALIPAQAPGQLHLLSLPLQKQSSSAVDEVRFSLGNQQSEGGVQGGVVLEAGAWPLRIPELIEIGKLLERMGLRLKKVRASLGETLVAASALGLESEDLSDLPSGQAEGEPPDRAGLTIHRGTLRSGDHLQAEGSLLLLGDVNPGARISAGGHVLIWGRLRGVAHAGCKGDTSARITALQLQPLQLRIAEHVARGPEERPPEGLAEQAYLEKGTIRIDPASPGWPQQL